MGFFWIETKFYILTMFLVIGVIECYFGGLCSQKSISDISGSYFNYVWSLTAGTGDNVCFPFSFTKETLYVMLQYQHSKNKLNFDVRFIVA